MGCRWTRTLSKRKSAVNQPIYTCPDRPLASADRPGQPHGPSGSATVGPIFNELPRHAPEPPHRAPNLNYPVGRSAYNDGRSAYNHGRSGYVSGQSAHESFEGDYYLNPRPSQQHFPSHYTMHQPINSRPRAQESFSAPPRRPERNDQTYEPYRANGNARRAYF